MPCVTFGGKSKRASEHLCEEAAQHFAHVGEIQLLLVLLSHVLEPHRRGNKKKDLDSVWLFCWVGANGFFFYRYLGKNDPGEILNGRELHRRWTECNKTQLSEGYKRDILNIEVYMNDR